VETSKQVNGFFSPCFIPRAVVVNLDQVGAGPFSARDFQRVHDVALVQLAACLLADGATRREQQDLLDDDLVPAPGNIYYKRLKLRLSGSARRSQKPFRDTPRFKFPTIFVRIEPFQRSNERSERGDHPVRIYQVVIQMILAGAGTALGLDCQRAAGSAQSPS
jgi:hypothetical protein